MNDEENDQSRVAPSVVAAERLDLPRKPQPDSSLPWTCQCGQDYTWQNLCELCGKTRWWRNV